MGSFDNAVVVQAAAICFSCSCPNESSTATFDLLRPRSPFPPSTLAPKLTLPQLPSVGNRGKKFVVEEESPGGKHRPHFGLLPVMWMMMSLMTIIEKLPALVVS